MNMRNLLGNKFSTVLFAAPLFLLLPATAATQGKIAFSSARDGNICCEIYVMDPDGTSQTRLTNSSGHDDFPSFSPDGSKITFSSDRDGNTKIFVMNADGTNATPLTNNALGDGAPRYSPDGSKIVFVSRRDDNGEIYIMNADGTGQTNLTNNSAEDTLPSFSPDGSKITFTSERDGNAEIYVMNADGTSQTRLTNNSAPDTYSAFKPDGGKIVFASGRIDSNYEIYVMNADGSNVTRLTTSAYDDIEPSFSPDGSKIVFASQRYNYPNYEVLVMDADGSNVVSLTSASEYNAEPSWGSLNTAPTISPIGVTVAQDSSLSSSSIATVNDAQDAENTLGVTVNGASSATSNGVTVSGISVDSSGNVTANISSTCGASNTSFTLRVTDSGSLYAETTLSVSVTPETKAPTLLLPANIVTSLPLNSTDIGTVVNFTVSATDNCDANPTVIAVPPSGSTFSVGTTTVNATATDASGNTATGSFTVTVLFDFAGFFQPVDNLPTVNIVSAGQAVPVKFSLSGYKGLNIFATGYPSSQQIACVGSSAVSAIDETVAAGGSSLNYDATTDLYIYIWKTQKAWKGTCRQLIVQLRDGALHVANFQFK